MCMCSWELAIFQAQYLGLSEAVGMSLGSRCDGYIAAGLSVCCAWLMRGESEREK